MESNITATLIADTALELLPFDPLLNQAIFLNAVAQYICHGSYHEIFLLNGYAGTGKTSLSGALIQALNQLGLKTVVLAPTGRAAKVAASFSKSGASTIHKRIYRGDSLSADFSGYFKAKNLDTNTIFFVDEASMISADATSPNSLLEDLLLHVFSTSGCRLIFSGDTAQLPPVGQSYSPAMNPELLKSIGFNPIVFNLNEPVRQAAASGILFNATIVRRRIDGSVTKPLKIHVSRFKDINIVENYDLADQISSSWNMVGKEETIIITRSNWRANLYNSAIRRQSLFAEDTLECSERIVISKNNYFWTQGDKELPFIANGEMAVIEWMGRTERKYGHTFRDVELRLSGYDKIIGVKMIVDTLTSDAPSLSRTEMNALYQSVLASYEGNISTKIKKAKSDPYFNAIQAKYAYCMTCHKAQGGQWKHVYIDLAGITPDNMGEDFYRWLYTAITRASERLFLVNPSVPVV